MESNLLLNKIYAEIYAEIVKFRKQFEAIPEDCQDSAYVSGIMHGLGMASGLISKHCVGDEEFTNNNPPIFKLINMLVSLLNDHHQYHRLSNPKNYPKTLRFKETEKALELAALFNAGKRPTELMGEAS